MNGCYLVWSPLTAVEGWPEFCQKNEHQGAWRTCQGGVGDARNPVTEAVSDIEAGATVHHLNINYSAHTTSITMVYSAWTHRNEYSVEMNAIEVHSKTRLLPVCSCTVMAAYR